MANLQGLGKGSMRKAQGNLILVCLYFILICQSWADDRQQPEILPLPKPIESKIFLPPPEEVPPEKPAPNFWKGGFEIGLSGATGNSEIFKLRVAGNAKRETKETIFKIDGFYAFAKADGMNTENRSWTEARQEWLMPNSPWSFYFSGQLLTDEFKAYDLRLAAYSGMSYLWIKNERILFKTRAGAGGTREIGGPDTAFHPEANAGLDFEVKISERQKFTSTVDVYPSLQDSGDYRVQAKAAYEILIDPTWNLTLKLGALDRYDSTPQGKLRNDLDYFATLLWSF